MTDALTQPDTRTDLVVSTVTDGVAHLELNRPEAFNAANLPLADALEAALLSAARDDSVGVVLLSGRGRAFCAGGDVKAMAAADDTPGMVTELAEASHRAVRALAALEKPVVAAVHGSVAGAGLGYACAADIVLAGESTKFLSAFIGIGVSPDSGTSWYLPRIVGLRRALELQLLNRVLSAEEARDWGIVTAIHPDGEVHAAGLALAQRLASGPAAALGRTRRLLHDSLDRTLDAHLDQEAAGIVHFVGTPEAQALVQAFGSR
ncbi:MAG TPA: enoyl-CoA hydratase-related protein [Nocardioidaceae bacterium]|nr:enoyl-CoA hydratase-related protein [Nocardioidaceae bacterium]